MSKISDEIIVDAATIKACFECGREAFEEGENWRDNWVNPYQKPCHEAWRDGWFSAFNEKLEAVRKQRNEND